MQVPVQITFRGMDTSEALEARIKEHVAKLESFHDRITSCDVVVELPHQHHRHGKQWHVRITLQVPGQELVVSKDPGKDGAHEDVYVTVRDAFLAARRQLEEYTDRQREDVRTTPVPSGTTLPTR